MMGFKEIFDSIPPFPEIQQMLWLKESDPQLFRVKINLPPANHPCEKCVDRIAAMVWEIPDCAALLEIEKSGIWPGFVRMVCSECEECKGKNLRSKIEED